MHATCARDLCTRPVHATCARDLCTQPVHVTRHILLLKGLLVLHLVLVISDAVFFNFIQEERSQRKKEDEEAERRERELRVGEGIK